ncbi:MAG: VCBS repeat-containing protein, partial [Planctomycetota bacterium]|nr:VCBS repeat-containing protein [Planctomycetota bacterium]
MSRARKLPTRLPTLLLALTAAGSAQGQDTKAEEAFVKTVFEVPRGAFQLHFADLDGDGDRDLLRISSAGYQAHLLGDDGAYAADPTPLRGWDGPRIAWDCADLDEDGAQELILMDGSSVRAVPFLQGTFGAPRPVLEEVATWCPRGLQRVRCARDVDGDGRTDLVLPRTAAHRIHLRREEGWSEPIEVAFRATVQQRFGDPEELGEQVSQAVRIPWFTVQDVDGDGLLDVQSETENEVAFHLATAAGLPAEPTWILDLAEFRAELGPETEIDLDDLFSTVSQRVEWRLVDLDGVAPLDLVVGVGSRLRVWLGGAAKGHAERPSQVVSAAGNV